MAADAGLERLTWRRRPDVRAVAAIMTSHIDDWDYKQARRLCMTTVHPCACTFSAMVMEKVDRELPSAS